MAKVRAMTPEVREVLTESRVEGNTVFLPARQLDRKLYEDVNKALTDLGGKWNRKAKGHVFARSPEEALAEALDVGGTVNEKQELQAFFTPPDLAEVVVGYADVMDMTVLEPSAGEGALADACMRAGATSVVCVEMHSPFIQVLAQKGYTVVDGDFLEAIFDPIFDRVVMNPPFTRDQDVKHVMRAVDALAPGGRLVSIMAGNTGRSAFVAMLTELTLRGMQASVYDMPDGAFKSSGTGVRTVLLIVDR